MISGNPNDASALIADTYLKISESGTYKEQGKFVHYFSTCMKRCFLLEKRKKRDYPFDFSYLDEYTENQRNSLVKIAASLISISTFEEPALIDIDRFIEDRLEKVEQLKARLKPHQQLLFVMIIEDGMTKTEIARQLGESRKTVERLFKPVKEKIKALKYGVH